ncbi:MAG: choice-of-anchor L domain-containing protein, partial [Saprospiraceae bacterium]
GDINVAVGPNDQDNASMGGGGATPDADLTAMSGSGAIFDMANIEFDFTPTQSPLTFEYVFASEEYCEYVGSQFNDAFGFFISGPGISGPFGGAANIATVPGNPGVYVTINNVNHQSFSGLYVNNTGSSGSLCGQQPSFAAAVNEVQFDGFTRKMVAIANVIPCQTYRIKLKIGDVGDGIFDSAVFLKAGSFDGGGNASVDFVVNGDPDIDVVYESCGEVKLIFDRVGGNLNTPLPVQYTIGGTATPGADYSPIPAVVVIPAGQDKVEITVNITNDQILEGDETIVLTLNNPCSCLEPREILTIRDLPRLEALVDTVVICGSGAGTLTATGIGGVEPYTYQWSNGSTEPTITPFVGVSTNFRVTVTDDCGKTAVATGRIIVSPLPNAQLLPPAPQICPGSSALINVNFNGTGPFEITYSLNGDDQPPITGIYNDPFQLEIFDPGLYRIVAVTDSLGCVGNGQGLLLVTESNLNLTGVATNITCTGGSNGSINTTVVGGQGPYNYTWVGPVNIANIPDPLNLTAGSYQVTVTDGFGCVDTLSFV